MIIWVCNSQHCLMSPCHQGWFSSGLTTILSRVPANTGSSPLASVAPVWPDGPPSAPAPPTGRPLPPPDAPGSPWPGLSLPVFVLAPSLLHSDLTHRILASGLANGWGRHPPMLATILGLTPHCTSPAPHRGHRPQSSQSRGLSPAQTRTCRKQKEARPGASWEWLLIIERQTRQITRKYFSTKQSRKYFFGWYIHNIYIDIQMMMSHYLKPGPKGENKARLCT